jgi:hypothetical protein
MMNDALAAHNWFILEINAKSGHREKKINLPSL